MSAEDRIVVEYADRPVGESERPRVKWKHAGTAYYAVADNRIVAILHPQRESRATYADPATGDRPEWVLVNVAKADEAWGLLDDACWEAIPNAEVLIPATEAVEAFLDPTRTRV